MKGRNQTISELVCPICRNKQTVPRSTGRQRENGHSKKFWCPICKQEVNHIEIRFNDWSGMTLADVYEARGLA